MNTALFAVAAAFAGVVTCPAPAGEPLSADYQVVAAGQPVAVYTARTLDAPFAGVRFTGGTPGSTKP